MNPLDEFELKVFAHTGDTHLAEAALEFICDALTQGIIDWDDLTHIEIDHDTIWLTPPP